jgi:Raf kinase inhibitor-like YbhB/YbcL family protein
MALSPSPLTAAGLRAALLLGAVVGLAGCGGDQGSEVDSDAAATVTVTSPVLREGAEVPTRFTCDGEAVSPPLQWSGPSPDGWALVVDDPDAPGGTFTHWVVLDIPAATTSVPAGGVPQGGLQVANSSGRTSYFGPCPPKGEHRYRFTVYALDAPTGLAEDASLDGALAAIGDRATSQGTLTAVYARP